MSWRNCYLAEKCIAMTNSGKKEALQWGIRNWKMLLDIAKMHLRLRALRLPHRSHSLLKAYKHFDIIIPHQIKVWQATDQAMVFCMILHRISIISIFLYSGTKPSFPQPLHPPHTFCEQVHYKPHCRASQRLLPTSGLGTWGTLPTSGRNFTDPAISNTGQCWLLWWKHSAIPF